MLVPYRTRAPLRRARTRRWRVAPDVRSPITTVHGIGSPLAVMCLDEATNPTEWAAYTAQMHQAFHRDAS